VAWTVATAGEAILFSGLTVMIGFLGLLFIGIPIMTSYAIGGAVVVGISVMGALTLLPALLGALGLRVNSLRLPWIGRWMVPTASKQGAAEEQTGFWHALAMG